jgi:hypothetical protein
MKIREIEIVFLSCVCGPRRHSGNIWYFREIESRLEVSTCRVRVQRIRSRRQTVRRRSITYPWTRWQAYDEIVATAACRSPERLPDGSRFCPAESPACCAVAVLGVNAWPDLFRSKLSCSGLQTRSIPGRGWGSLGLRSALGIQSCNQGRRAYARKPLLLAEAAGDTSKTCEVRHRSSDRGPCCSPHKCDAAILGRILG